MGINVTKIYLDTVGIPEAYKAKLDQVFNSGRNQHIEIRVESKADSKYPVVSAASICAKVVRDTELENW